MAVTPHGARAPPPKRERSRGAHTAPGPQVPAPAQPVAAHRHSSAAPPFAGSAASPRRGGGTSGDALGPGRTERSAAREAAERAALGGALGRGGPCAPAARALCSLRSRRCPGGRRPPRPPASQTRDPSPAPRPGWGPAAAEWAAGRTNERTRRVRVEGGGGAAGAEDRRGGPGPRVPERGRERPRRGGLGDRGPPPGRGDPSCSASPSPAACGALPPARLKLTAAGAAQGPRAGPQDRPRGLQASRRTEIKPEPEKSAAY